MVNHTTSPPELQVRTWRSVYSSGLLIWQERRCTVLQNIRCFCQGFEFSAWCDFPSPSPPAGDQEGKILCPMLVLVKLLERITAAVDLSQQWVCGGLPWRGETCLLAVSKHFRCLWVNGMGSSRQTCGWLVTLHFCLTTVQHLRLCLFVKWYVYNIITTCILCVTEPRDQSQQETESSLDLRVQSDSYDVDTLLPDLWPDGTLALFWLARRACMQISVRCSWRSE